VNKRRLKKNKGEPFTTELLLTADGRILVHNLTAPFAELLSQLDPEDQQILSRIVHSKSSS
jgi:hypothetical protein